MYKAQDANCDLFTKELSKVIQKNLDNDFNDNFDYFRFGSPEREIVDRTKSLEFFLQNMSNFSNTFRLLQNSDSRSLFLDLIAFRLLGHRKVKLPLAFTKHRELIEKLDLLCNKSNWIPAGIFDWKLYLTDLTPINYPLKMYSTGGGVLIDFILKQYEYGISPSERIGVKQGDIVIDAGACGGDTALYFANLTGQQGKVFSFEFTDSNLEVFHKNIDLNPLFSDNIWLIKQPVWNVSGEKLFFNDCGPGSSIVESKESAKGEYVSSIAIDDLSFQYNLPRVDFIKMDIEGSELKALQGAANTIQKHKPQLAITIYHKFEDFFTIPEYLKTLNPSYKFYLNHFTIFQEESVLFATT